MESQVSWRYVLPFIASWLVFIGIGRIFLENLLGQYHTASTKFASICKILFLITFVVACTLLELISFEILGVLHPTFRQFMWTASLGVLCSLLNYFIPCGLGASIAAHLDFSTRYCFVLGVCNVIGFHFLLRILKFFIFLSAPLSSYGRPPKAVVLSNSVADMAEIRGGDGSYAPSFIKNAFDFILFRAKMFYAFASSDVQTNVAIIAVVGTTLAAVIAGFATVSFPLEQLIVPVAIKERSGTSQVDSHETVAAAAPTAGSTIQTQSFRSIAKRETELLLLTREISKKKKILLLLSTRQYYSTSFDEAPSRSMATDRVTRISNSFSLQRSDQGSSNNGVISVVTPGRLSAETADGADANTLYVIRSGDLPEPSLVAATNSGDIPHRIVLLSTPLPLSQRLLSTPEAVTAGSRSAEIGGCSTVSTTVSRGDETDLCCGACVGWDLSQLDTSGSAPSPHRCRTLRYVRYSSPLRSKQQQSGLEESRGGEGEGVEEQDQRWRQQGGATVFSRDRDSSPAVQPHLNKKMGSGKDLIGPVRDTVLGFAYGGVGGNARKRVGSAASAVSASSDDRSRTRRRNSQRRQRSHSYNQFLHSGRDLSDVTMEVDNAMMKVLRLVMPAFAVERCMQVFAYLSATYKRTIVRLQYAVYSKRRQDLRRNGSSLTPESKFGSSVGHTSFIWNVFRLISSRAGDFIFLTFRLQKPSLAPQCQSSLSNDSAVLPESAKEGFRFVYNSAVRVIRSVVASAKKSRWLRYLFTLASWSRDVSSSRLRRNNGSHVITSHSYDALSMSIQLADLERGTVDMSVKNQIDDRKNNLESNGSASVMAFPAYVWRRMLLFCYQQQWLSWAITLKDKDKTSDIGSESMSQESSSDTYDEYGSEDSCESDGYVTDTSTATYGAIERAHPSRLREDGFQCSCQCCRTRDINHGRRRDLREKLVLQKQIKSLESSSRTLFLDIVALRELAESAREASTPVGRLLRASSYLLSFIGIVKLSVGAWRVLSFFATGGRFQMLSQQADTLTTFSTYVLVYFRFNFFAPSGADPEFGRQAAVSAAVASSAWTSKPVLGTLYIASLALLHIRAFIVCITEFAKQGIVSTSTEVYSLVLAYLVGAYSIACVLFLRTQLPLRRRRGVTVALGEDLLFDFYFWLFDAVFIVSCIVTAVVVTSDYKKKRRLLVTD